MTPTLSAVPGDRSADRSFDATDFIQARATTDGGEVFVEWTGAVYALLPEGPQQLLFDIVGMNVARAVPTPGGGWNLISRELTYYLDPQTGEVLRSWQNPWTGDRLPVVHVANDPVQNLVEGPVAAKIAGGAVTFVCDIFPAYPNPLGGDPRFLDYSPSAQYQAAEFFKLTVPLAELRRPISPAVDSMTVAWHRIGPWLPWMKMGDRPGQLVYSACGQKVAGFEALPALLQREIATRLPTYRHAPEQPTPQKNMTSWRYFKQHFEAYLRGEIFPLAELAA